MAAALRRLASAGCTATGSATGCPALQRSQCPEVQFRRPFFEESYSGANHMGLAHDSPVPSIPLRLPVPRHTWFSYLY
jgi:hypothetical protein